MAFLKVMRSVPGAIIRTKDFREDQTDDAAEGPSVTFFGDARRNDGDVEIVLGDREQSGGQVAGDDGGDAVLHESILQRRERPSCQGERSARSSLLPVLEGAITGPLLTASSFMAINRRKVGLELV